jgi:hypothetical protein
MFRVVMTNHCTNTSSTIATCDGCLAQAIFKSCYELALSLSSIVCLSFAIVPA